MSSAYRPPHYQGKRADDRRERLYRRASQDFALHELATPRAIDDAMEPTVEGLIQNVWF
ncbi:hypothetical protein MPL3365_170053 [Mesorhizobium plurifarium]|uniref:Uncharacterized protein n=1 Tax=Mesorhizobium plurifarium TaxID=69974 RepID=A0A090FYP9_MESPL|nr:hypothetical protein MPL3365_170053 [Mesorhizobium plurifarium]